MNRYLDFIGGHPGWFLLLLLGWILCLLLGRWLICRGIRELREWRHWRRCHVSPVDADWLAAALGEQRCPVCDRELTRH